MALKLYVGNLNYNTTEESLRAAFELYGDVISVKIIQGKGFGFVEYSSNEAAEAAKAGMDGKNLDGRSLRVNDARPPEKKSFGDRGERSGFSRSGNRNERGGFNKRY
jgi:RNA recognition motif-containing protein